MVSKSNGTHFLTESIMRKDSNFCKDLLRYKDPVLQMEKISQWKKINPDKVKESNAKSNQRAKNDALSHYGKGGKAVCCWDGCDVDDPDLLTIDHIHNDGAILHGRGQAGQTGVDLYRKLRKSGWPKGYQTLCWNHQWKKEITLRREKGTHRGTKRVCNL